MNVKHKLLVGAALAAPFLMIGAAHAQQNPNGRMTTQSTEMAQTTTTDGQPLTTDQQAALKQRMDKRKAEIKTVVTAAERQRVQKNCKNAQGKLNSLRGRITGLETSRSQVYDNLVTRLKKVSEKAGTTPEGTELNTQITTLEEMIDTFKSDLADYKTAVGDLADSDCAADGEAFKKTLVAAREAQKKVQADAIEIKKYVQDTIKPTLVTIRQQNSEKEGGTE